MANDLFHYKQFTTTSTKESQCETPHIQMSAGENLGHYWQNTKHQPILPPAPASDNNIYATKMQIEN